MLGIQPSQLDPIVGHPRIQPRELLEREFGGVAGGAGLGGSQRLVLGRQLLVEALLGFIGAPVLAGQGDGALGRELDDQRALVRVEVDLDRGWLGASGDPQRLQQAHQQ